MQPHTIRTLTVLFDTEISSSEITLFRGAMLRMLGSEADELFHNHAEGDTYRYSYPMVQYKRLGHRAAIVSLNEGADRMGALLARLPETIEIGKRRAPIAIRSTIPASTAIATTAAMQHYHLTRWLPLNHDNYDIYTATTAIADRIKMLERILCGNLLSMLKGLGITADEELRVSITDLAATYSVRYKGVGLTAMDIDFECNLTLPRGIGLGKNASIGCGVVHTTDDNDNRRPHRAEV